MVEACQHVAADPGLRQRLADRRRQAHGFQLRMDLKRDPGGHEVVGEPQRVRLCAGQHHRQPLGLPDCGLDAAGQRLSVRPEDVDVLSLAEYGMHGGQQGLEVRFAGHAASLELPAAAARGPGRSGRAAVRRSGGPNDEAAAPPEGNGRRRQLAALLLGFRRNSVLGTALRSGCGLVRRRRSDRGGSRLGGRGGGGHEGAARVVQVFSCVVSRPMKKPGSSRRSRGSCARPWGWPCRGSHGVPARRVRP